MARADCVAVGDAFGWLYELDRCMEAPSRHRLGTPVEKLGQEAVAWVRGKVHRKAEVEGVVAHGWRSRKSTIPDALQLEALVTLALITRYQELPVLFADGDELDWPRLGEELAHSG